MITPKKPAARRRVGSHFASHPTARFISNFVASPPPTLFHYTSQAALYGIIENNGIWATDVRFLNDLKEYNYARKFAADTMAVIARRSTSHGIRELCEQIVQRLAEPQDTTYFTFSLSEFGDSLNQWRSYTPSGPGYAIGFSASAIEAKCIEHGYLFGKCLYKVESIEAAIIELAESYVADLYGYFPFFRKGEINEDLISARSRRFVRLFMGYAGFLKHPAFSEETEWRVIIERPSADRSGVFLRSGAHALVPYLKVDFKDTDFLSAIRKIIIKPSPHSVLMECGLRVFLESKINQISLTGKEIEPIEVIQSEVPYRE